jgi:CubicO group peptidase (beta-lactamase class C family)
MKRLHLFFVVLLTSFTLGITSSVYATEILNNIFFISAGTGYTSLDLCTRVNVGNDNFVRVRDYYVVPKVRPLPVCWSIIDNPGVNVSTSAFGLYTRIGTYRKGLGCTVVQNFQDEILLRKQPFTETPRPPISSAAWPLGEGEAETGLLTGMQMAAIDSAAAGIFTENSGNPNKMINSIALLIAKNGQLVYEHYATGYNRNQPQIGWSMTKSLTAIVAGLLENEGRIGVDDPVGLGLWAGTDKAAITWRQLLNMASGLKWDESSSATPNDVYKMLFDHYDNAAYAAGKPLAYKPGTRFIYSTGAQTIAMAAMKEKLGGTHQAIYDYYQGKLFAPLGIRDGIIEPDYSGTPIGGARGILRPVDWLRLGQLIVNNGKWNGRQLISPGWINFMKTPSPANPSYDGSIWNKTWEKIPEELQAQLPDDTILFNGIMGQFVVMIPSHNLVLVHMGVTYDYPRTIARIFGTVADLLAQGL